MLTLFVVTQDGRTVCFVEDYSFAEGIGSISAIELFSDKKYIEIGSVIKDPFHMSFPYIFRYKDDLFIMPETNESNSIRVYKCDEFPDKWSFHKEIMNGMRAADSMVFEVGGKWWLLTNISDIENGDLHSRLMAFYSDSPLSSNWTPHQLNPIVFDSNIARNGGLLYTENKELVRVRQCQKFDSYGDELSLAKINITVDSYSEETIARVTPKFFKNISGCHHIHGINEFTVFDFYRKEKANKL